MIGDRIVAVGPDLAAPEDARVVDAAGQWVVPGLLDAHVHLMNVPGDTWLGLDAAGHDAMVRRQLRSYLACGVTTVLDAASIPARAARCGSRRSPVGRPPTSCSMPSLPP